MYTNKGLRIKHVSFSYDVRWKKLQNVWCRNTTKTKQLNPMKQTPSNYTTARHVYSWNYTIHFVTCGNTIWRQPYDPDSVPHATFKTKKGPTCVSETVSFQLVTLYKPHVTHGTSIWLHSWVEHKKVRCIFPNTKKATCKKDGIDMLLGASKLNVQCDITPGKNWQTS